MEKHDLLLEIGLEEMPSRFITASAKQLSDKVRAWLEEKGISHGEIRSYSTPRRLAVFVRDMADAQPDLEEEAKGPAKKIALDAEGNWSKAAVGFTRGQGMTVDDIYFKEIGGTEYVHVNKFIKGRPVAELLPELEDIITHLSFPKNMRWADRDLRFIRPIKWLAALYGKDIIPFSVAGVETGHTTKGHRFLGGQAEISMPADYEQILKEQFVIADPDVRRQMILDGIRSLEQEKGWVIPVDEELLEEVNNLLEYPTVLSGSFEEEFLEVPDKVLITSMKEHQRYFPVKDKEGRLLSYFVTVRNGNAENLDMVSRGNEKVLRARLSDAAFFYKEDQKRSIADNVKKLDSIVYHEEIGTLAAKTGRVRNLTEKLADLLGLADEKAHAVRAAEIAKFDLVSHMVYEFPELQGYMGEKYALLQGEHEAAAHAINEHYMPRHADDAVPPSAAGAVLSVAEKMDTVASFFAIGIIPTGSQDPYALRRQAGGIVQILLEKKWDLTLEELSEMALAEIEKAGFMKKEREEVLNDLMSFFKARIKHILSDRSIRYDLIDALLQGPAGNAAKLAERAAVLENERESESFKPGIEAISRVMNIARKSTGKAEINPALFENEEEKALYGKFLSVSEAYQAADSEAERFALLFSLQPEIDSYFDHTMVMAEDEAVRKNRLSLMKEISLLAESFAAMNQIMTV